MRKDIPLTLLALNGPIATRILLKTLEDLVEVAGVEPASEDTATRRLQA